MLPILALFGCYLEEHEKGGHSWRLEGIKDDSTAVVKVVYCESGSIHDHHFMSLYGDETFYNEISSEYIAVRMTSYWRGKSHSTRNALLPARYYAYSGMV